MNFSHFVAGFIAGIIGFAVNICAQFVLEKTINFYTALATALGLFIIFFIITARYKA